MYSSIFNSILPAIIAWCITNKQLSYNRQEGQTRFTCVYVCVWVHVCIYSAWLNTLAKVRVSNIQKTKNIEIYKKIIIFLIKILVKGKEIIYKRIKFITVVYNDGKSQL